MHLGTGKFIEKKDIPQWRGVPPGKGPFERVACGAYMSSTVVAHTKRGVTCQSCRRTKLYKEFVDGQETPKGSG